MHKVYLALLLIIIVIAIIIISLGITIKVTKNKECFTTKEIEQKLGIASDKVIKDHDTDKKIIHGSNNNASVGDIIFMPYDEEKQTISENGCEYLLIKNGQTFDFKSPKYDNFINKFLDGKAGTYKIRMSDGAIGSSHETSFTPENIGENKIIFNRIGKDGVVEVKDAVISSDGMFKSTIVAPYFFSRSQSADIETPWLEKPIEIEADVDIKSLLTFGKVYLYVCIWTKSS